MSVPEKHAYPDANLYPQVPPAYTEGQPYGPVPPQPYGPAPSQPYGPAPSQPYGPAPTQAQGPVPSQPYVPVPSQPYGPSAPNSTANPGATIGIVIAQPVGPRSTNITCRSCNQQIMTKVGYTPSTKTHIIALLLCVFGCCPCAVIPYCMDSCQNAEHYCPHCSAYIGTYQG